MKLLAAFALSIAPVSAFADASASVLDFSQPSGQPYAMASMVSSVKSLSSKAGYSVTLRTIVEEGSLNSNKVLVQLTTSEGDETNFLVVTELAAVGKFKFSWINANNSTAGLYLMMEGLSGGTKHHVLEIKLTDATGGVLDQPFVNSYDGVLK